MGFVLVPTEIGEPGASVKSPLAFPVLVSTLPNKIEILFEVEFTRTTSAGWLVVKVLLLRKTPVPMATWPVSLALSVIGDGVT